ncbi:hypothetical protein NMG60_11035840 [Bertholletia excelsa]
MGGGSGDKEAEPEVARGVDCVVGGRDTGEGFAGGRGFDVEELHEGAVHGAVGASATVGGDAEACNHQPRFPWKRCSVSAALVGSHFLDLYLGGSLKARKYIEVMQRRGY